MTTITIKETLEGLDEAQFDTAQDLMDTLAELNGFKLLWEVDRDDLPDDVKEALVEYEQSKGKPLLNI